MAGVSVKMGVDASQFKAGLQEAQNSVKTLDAALKMNEKQLKATGDAEIYMANKSKLLNKQMEEQKKVVANIQKQMAEMKGRGVEETSEAYQKLERSLYNATGKMMDIQTQLNGLADSEQNAAKGADEVATNLNNISKKVSFDAVISGIGKITSGLEKAAQKAVEVGKQIWDNIMDSAAYADDVETLATRMGLTTTEVQQMQYVANRFEAPVETVAKSWKKVKMSMTSDSEEIAAGFAKLGVQTQEFSQGKMGAVVTGMRDYKDVFWETGEAIMRMTDEAEQERLAQQLLGRSWDEMIPLFKAGREEYEAAMESAPVASEKAIQNAAELNDKVAELEQSFMTLKTEVVGDIAPALTAAATTLEKLITSVTDYLQTDEGQEALQNMADAVSGLFDDLSKIDPEDVVNKFAGVFNQIVSAFTWIEEHWDAVRLGIEGIAGAFTLLKLTEGGLKVLQLVNGLKALGGAKGVEEAVKAASGGPGIATGVGGLGNLLWGAAPLAVSVVAMAPAIIEQIRKEREWTEEQEGLEQSGQGLIETGETANGLFIKKAAQTTGPEKYADGTYVRNFGMLVVRPNDEQHTQLMGLQSRKGQEFAELMTALNMYGTSPLGNKTSQDLLRYWESGGNGFNQMQVTALITDIAHAMEQYSESKMNNADYTQQTEATRRRLPNGWMYDENGNPVNIATGAGVPVESNWGKFGSWDNRTFYEWYKEENVKYNQERQDASEAITDAANKMSTLPESVAAAVSAATINVVVQLSGEHANGLSYVPYDGYLGVLHRGERVLTARENRRYTTNNYFGNVNLNNGLEIEALTESIDRRNRRQMAGFGAM